MILHASAYEYVTYVHYYFVRRRAYKFDSNAFKKNIYAQQQKYG